MTAATPRLALLGKICKIQIIIIILRSFNWQTRFGQIQKNLTKTAYVECLIFHFPRRKKNWIKNSIYKFSTAPIAIQANPNPWPMVEPVFHFGPGFEHQHYCPTHSQGPQPHEYIVFFHINPGVSVTFQIGGNREVIRGKNFPQFTISRWILWIHCYLNHWR